MVIAIDLGSNTLRIALVGKNTSSSSFENLKIFEKIVGAARGLSQSGTISQEAKGRLFLALKEAKEQFDFKNLPHFAVATQAFRAAKNSREIVDEILIKFGIKFHIISADLEARLTALGVQNGLRRAGISSAQTAFIDLGGASTEVAREGEFKSFDFGIITFYERCASEALEQKVDLLTMMKERAKVTVFDAREFLGVKNRVVALTSGVPTTMAAIKQGMSYESYDASKVNGARLKFSDFDELCDKILSLSKKESDKLVGEGRGMFVAAGMILLKALLCGRESEFVVIDDGLREGAGAAYLDENNKILQHLKEIK